MAPSAVGLPLRRRHARAIGTALSLLLLFDPAHAGEQELVSMPLEDLLALEVSGASRFTQTTRDAPSAVTIVTREQIRDHAWHTLADLLDSIPGLFAATDRTYRYLGVRGFLQPSDYNTNVLLLIDGIPANDAIYNQAFLGTEGLLDMALVERVEFIPGPGSSVYGSNAILGVINVITMTGRSLGGTEVEVSAGNHKARGAAVRHGAAGDRHDLLLSASGWRSEGEEVTLPDTATATYGKASGLEEDIVRRALTRYAWSDFVLLGAYSDRRKGYATAPYETVFGDPRTKARDRQMLVSLTHQAEWRPALNLLSRLSFGAVEYHAHWAYPPPEPINVDHSDSRWWGAELQATDLRFDRHTLIYGLEYRDEYRLVQRNADHGPALARLDDRRDARHVGLYLQDEWSGLAWGGSDWRLNAGLRFDHYSSFGSALNPRIGLVQHLSSATTLKYLFGTAYRAPTVYEMHYHDGNETMKANPRLRPERIRSLEVAAEHVDASGWHWQGSLFHNRIRDVIVQETDPEDELLVYRNRGRATTRGVVLSVRRQWSSGGRLSVSTSWQEARDGSSGERLTHTPRTVNKLDLTLPVGTWRATVEGRHVGRRRTHDGHVGAQAWANGAIVSTRPVLGGARVSLRVDNLFDRDLFDPASEEFDHDRLPREGRTARISLIWAL